MSSPTNILPLDEDSFRSFFEAWLVGQNQHLQELRAVSETQSQATSLSDQETQLRPLLNRVIAHYEDYYRVKAEWRHGNVMDLLSPTWTSALEDAYMWIGGWRPSMAFRLLYSEARIQEHPVLGNFPQGGRSGDQLRFLSPAQLNRVDELQGTTLEEEKDISDEMAQAQVRGADQDLVELSHIPWETVDEDRVDEALEAKEGRFENAVEKADDLRLRTLKGVIDILNPLEAVHFLIAAADLHLSFHDWGYRHDMIQRGVSNGMTGDTDMNT